MPFFPIDMQRMGISALAFAGSDVVRVKLPFMTTAIGHKAFYQCNKLEMVIFGSYNVPNFEEEFDPKYYETFEHIPGTGEYGEYTDYDGNQKKIMGTGMLPYYMWNATDGQYFSVFYGANFIDYVGYVETKPMMVKPVNGVGYDSFICDQYFDLRIDGPAAPDKTSVEAIKLIKAIPERVTADDKALVKSAREAFDKIATTEQQALVNNYSELVSAEQRIKSLDSDKAEEKDDKNDDKKESKGGSAILVISIVVAVLVVLGLAGLFLLNKKNKTNKKEADPLNENIEE